MDIAELDASILAIGCEQCGAEPGQWCVQGSGKQSPGFHGIRLRTAKIIREQA